MRIGSAHLTYCTNVHNAVRLAEVRAALRAQVAEVKARVCPDAPFGVGLWLSHAAAEELAQGTALPELREELERLGLYVFTLNGFPFGTFHGQPVKAAVCAPDWRDPRRLEHTDRLATLLAALLPEGLTGSISTVPGGFGSEITSEGDAERIAHHMLEHAAHLHRLEATTGRRITLAIEPEPCCFIETTPQLVAFFEQRLLARPALARLAARCGVETTAAERIVRRHLGACLDACHTAVEYEEARDAVQALRAAGVALAKVQLSSGLRAAPADRAARAALAAFVEPVYLHQVVERRGAELVRHVDLPDALHAARDVADAGAPEWRVHFHVPLHRARFGVLESTQAFVRELLALHRAAPLCEQLEVETYTWDVLPQDERPSVLADGIADELRFCLRELGAEHAR